MKYELEIITDIYSPPDKTGIRKILVKDHKIKKLFELNDIELEEYTDNKGKLIKKYCAICTESNYYKINKPYEELKELILNKTKPIGGFMNHYKTKK